MAKVITARQFSEALSEDTDWKAIGTYLGVSQADIRVIESRSHHESVTQCLIDLHTVIEERGIQLSWRKIYDTLNSLRKFSLANKICNKYILPPQPSPLPTDSEECPRDRMERMKNIKIEKIKKALFLNEILDVMFYAAVCSLSLAMGLEPHTLEKIRNDTSEKKREMNDLDFSNVDDSPLNDISPILRAIETVTIDWKSLGYALELPEYEIKKIGKMGKNESDKRRKIVMKWRDLGNASWKKLAQALCCDTDVSKINVAKKIASEHPPQSVTTETVTQSETTPDDQLTSSITKSVSGSTNEQNDLDSSSIDNSPLDDIIPMTIDWKSLGYALELPECEIERIGKNGDNESDKRRKIVMKWRELGKASACRKKLAQAFCDPDESKVNVAKKTASGSILEMMLMICVVLVTLKLYS